VYFDVQDGHQLIAEKVDALDITPVSKTATAFLEIDVRQWTGALTDTTGLHSCCSYLKVSSVIRWMAWSSRTLYWEGGSAMYSARGRGPSTCHHASDHQTSESPITPT
jgi:hypothetical protein